MNQWQVLLAFARANLLGYGGGHAVLPLMKAEVVDTYQWLTAEQFGDALAIGNTLPGPIATKMSAYIGYKVAGPTGAVMALLGTVLPTALMMIALGAILIHFKDSAVIKGAITGVKPVVFVLFLLLAMEFFPFARPDRAGWLSTAIATAAFVTLFYLKLPKPFAIMAGLVIGGLFIR